MKATDLFSTVFIFFIFITLNFYVYVNMYMSEIKNNWPLYRCNPTIMPFASYFGVDPVENFGKCIQKMQAGFMQEFLAPVFHVLNTIGDTTGELMNSISDIKGFADGLQGSTGGGFMNFGGMLRNLSIAFQTIIAAVIDTFARIGGIVRLIMELFDGFVVTAQSAADNFCFHPDTLVSMADGTTKKMGDVTLGERLKGDRVVVSTMKIRPTETMKYFSMYSKELQHTIFVTGDHFVEDSSRQTINDADKMVPVRKHPKSQETIKETEDMVCLITDDNRIPIGEYVFCDWEDDDISRSYYLSKLC